jgi:hypothetical protein
MDETQATHEVHEVQDAETTQEVVPAAGLLPAPGKRGKISGKTILTREKERQALELRKAGATYQVIADTVGYAGPSSAWEAVNRGLERIPKDSPDNIISIENERLNYMLMLAWRKVQQPDHPEHAWAMSEARSIMRDIRSLHNVGRGENTVNNTLNIDTGDNILVVQGDKEEYLKGLKLMAGAIGEIDLPASDTRDIEDAVCIDSGQTSLFPPDNVSNDEDEDIDDQIYDGEIIDD